MGVSRKTLSKISNGHARLTPEVALRLSIALCSSANIWLGHQATYVQWQLALYKGAFQAVPQFGLPAESSTPVWLERGLPTCTCSRTPNTQ